MKLVPEKRISSVGIDVGTSTSHLIFSELVLKKDPSSKTEKYYIAERYIKYRGNIFFTPLKEGNEIDIEELSKVLLEEYKKAEINVSDIDTGAVIITGESARRENAERIVEQLSRETGKFVAASAGPNFESIISAYGSGAVKLSKQCSCKIIHTDVGGGTSNIAVIDNGKIISTACINIGGRLIVIDDQKKIVRIEPAGQMVLEHCNLDLKIGNKLLIEYKQLVAKTLATTLIEVLFGKKLSDLALKLMLTLKLAPECFTGEYGLSFSGGVAEYIYQKNNQEYDDLGLFLGGYIREKLIASKRNWIEVPEKIRATVIGASEYTLQVSGSTTFMSTYFSEIGLPLKNLPIVKPDIKRELLSEEYLIEQINKALNRLDIIEGEVPIALAFQDPVRTVYEKLKIFSFGLVKALPKTIEKNIPIILVFDTDIGNSVGNVLFRETGIKTNILSIDEISLQEGDFIDIGKPIVDNKVFPVVVKSLVFQ
jgi:ethanolamine utilization protein EutA